jgi:3-hydroxyisobutyrate dehydrogenase-like beta-hydroxyacid dehydrogenase
MGCPVVERLAQAGVGVTAWNRTRSKAEPLAADGVKIADEPVQLAGRDVVFTMVGDSANLEEVTGRLFADPEHAPRFLVDCSTVSAESSARVREVAAAREPVQSVIAQGRTAEDFAVLLELEAGNSGLSLTPEETPVDDGLGGPAPAAS